MRVQRALYVSMTKKTVKRRASESDTLAINLTCPKILYYNGEAAWKQKGYKGPADVFQTALRKLAGMELSV